MRDYAAATPETRWACYENHDLGHPDAGNLRFLAVGPDCTLKEAPPGYPDTHLGIGWRYRHIGWVDLAQGTVTEAGA